MKYREFSFFSFLNSQETETLSRLRAIRYREMLLSVENVTGTRVLVQEKGGYTHCN